MCLGPLSGDLISDGRTGELKQWLLWVMVCAGDEPLFHLAAAFLFLLNRFAFGERGALALMSIGVG
jgi:hypothetical protein